MLGVPAPAPSPGPSVSCFMSALGGFLPCSCLLLWFQTYYKKSRHCLNHGSCCCCFCCCIRRDLISTLDCSCPQPAHSKPSLLQMTVLFCKAGEACCQVLDCYYSSPMTTLTSWVGAKHCSWIKEILRIVLAERILLWTCLMASIRSSSLSTHPMEFSSRLSIIGL